MNFKKNKINKLLIDKQFDELSKKKFDPNNILVNAAALQDQLINDLGLKKKKKSLKFVEKNEKVNYLPKLIQNNFKSEVESEKEVYTRRKNYLDNLTFAQKIGLAEIPKMPLSYENWKQIEDQSLKRDDHKSSCPICLEKMSAQQSIICSCSHVFHKVKTLF
jgi:hypothetical protein